MNLFIESVANYLKEEWDRVFRSSECKEARFIVQSLAPRDVTHLFRALEDARLVWMKEMNIRCYFKVATRLWDEWVKTETAKELDSLMAQAGGIDQSGGRKWIDEEDKLTWYRNRTSREEGVDGLVVVLVGLQHTTDQGGLKDFHRVDESRIWAEMDESFELWISRLLKKLSLEDSQLEQFDLVLQRLNKVRPVSLGKLANFLESKIISSGGCYNLTDLIEKFLKELPYWGLPTILPEDSPTKITGKDAARALEDAHAFMSHQRYKTPSARNGDWKLIDDWFEGHDFQMPDMIEGLSPITPDEYRQALRQFIFDASASAKEKLLHVNALPLLQVLGKRVKKKSKTRNTIPTFSGGSLEALLQGLWESLVALGPTKIVKDLTAIEFHLKRFDHDLVADQGSDADGDYLARKLLRGCLGGLNRVLEGMDFRIPASNEEAELPRKQWGKEVTVSLVDNIDSIPCGRSRARPSIQFEVKLLMSATEESTSDVYKWLLGPTQHERVRFECANKLLHQWSGTHIGKVVLPANAIPTVTMTALYYASDEDEANRLLSQAMAEMLPINLLDGLPIDHLDTGLVQNLKALFSDYCSWLETLVKEGFYAARVDRLPQLLNSYSTITKQILDSSLRGSKDLLRRFYKAYLVLEKGIDPNDAYLQSAVAWSLSPAVLELTQARVSFLADSFPETVGELAIGKEKRVASATFQRMLDLAEIHRPLAGLVIDASQTLSPAIKSFGLIHYLGQPPSASKSLAVQSLLRDADDQDSFFPTESADTSEEKELVQRVLEDYQQLYPFAQDGLRILAINVRDLQTIVAGVERFLDVYLQKMSSESPPFHCSLMVYTTSSSPMAMESRIAAWRDRVIERRREKERTLILSVGHRYAPKEKIVELLSHEKQVYDIAFLFHFLRGELAGQSEPASPFEFSFEGWSGLQFPIAEYPRPAIRLDPSRRQTVLSNRRLRIQSGHANLSARLRYPTQKEDEHIIVGEVDYKPWTEIVNNLHKHAHWLASIDPFVDKGLLTTDDPKDCRKIVGFKSGLGAYGELNLTISTQQDTLSQLTRMVEEQLTKLLPHGPQSLFEQMAVRVVDEAEEVIGLASLRAVVGTDERIREVVGFAAIRRTLAGRPGTLRQMLPLDSVQHWFKDATTTLRPDLLHLSLEVRETLPPLVRAVIIECKLGQQNPQTLAKACEQVQDGLQHLTELLAPMRGDLLRIGFDRRYWWAQLHRAMTSRSVVSLPDEERIQHCQALERLAEGDYEIRWEGVVFTFWSDKPDTLPTINQVGIPNGTIPRPFDPPAGFSLTHVEIGYNGLASIFSDNQSWSQIELGGVPLSILPDSPSVKTGEGQPTMTIEMGVEKADVPKTSTRPTTEVPETKSGGPLSSSFSSVSEQDEENSPPLEKSYQVSNLPAPDLPDQSEHVSKTPEGLPTSSIPEPTQTSAINVASSPFAVRVPEKILLGTRKNGEPVFWHFGHPQLANRHLLLFGTSGSGKTYGIQCLLSEMAVQELHSLIVDYTDGFLPNQVEPIFNKVANPKSHFVLTERLPLNPFRRQSQIIDPSAPPFEETPYQVATRLQSIFSSVYEMGDQQAAALIRVLEAGIEESNSFGLDDIVPRLEDDNKNAASLANKITPLVKARPFRQASDSNWKEMVESTDHMVHILQLKGYAREIWQLITEFVLWDLWDYAQNTGSKNRPLPIVLDEIQNLDHSSSSPLDKMLREGRKFGLAMILATQTTSQFNQEQRDRLFQAGHKLFFKPASTEVDRFAALLATTTPEKKATWAQRLASLEKGQCWSLGPVLKANGALQEEAVLVNITSLEKRALKAPF